eukprot:CAMPEP_0173133486 /NCGR_PEP_ID=MMETSP1105-20130129/756_1 /TAXON_ID=2985 /ORGANISM="Ochromonas sp., Strain BG-1" /LENGTH=398 /DNA_ID=CAMNT_0014045165 /DNA_START=218 /DNA_END=1414 /DNA_ORIENTATION=-
MDAKPSATTPPPSPPQTSSAATGFTDIITNQQGKTLFLELNRPKALNALNLDMCLEMKKVLTERINHPSSTVSHFIMKGVGEKAFCAGGDIKTLYTSVISEKDEIQAYPGKIHVDFFRHEYILDYLLGTSNKPQISFWNGIVMGGGVGISVLGEFRVATEKTVFAMPECGIGLFPDVGGSAWLPHLNDGYGNYIGMIGTRLNAADLVHAGIATHFIQTKYLPEVEKEIVTADIPNDPVNSRKTLKAILDKYQSISGKTGQHSILQENSDNIKKCFGEHIESVEQAIHELSVEDGNGNKWATQALQSIRKSSPTSLKVTFEQLRRGRTLDAAECFNMEFRIVIGCMRNNDFREGVRALLVDKDNSPKWQPATLEEVSKDYLESFFQPLGEYELNLRSNK